MHDLMGNWRGIALRALAVALIIGAGLTLINQRAALFGPEAVDWASLALSFVSPFVVVIISQLLGIRAFRREGGFARMPRTEPFLKTLAGHGIASRALVMALLVGTALSGIMLVLADLDGGRAGLVPPTQIAQVYALPLVFGAVSQALSYRRARARFLSRPGRESTRVA